MREIDRETIATAAYDLSQFTVKTAPWPLLRDLYKKYKKTNHSLFGSHRAVANQLSRTQEIILNGKKDKDNEFLCKLMIRSCLTAEFLAKLTNTQLEAYFGKSYQDEPRPAFSSPGPGLFSNSIFSVLEVVKRCQSLDLALQELHLQKDLKQVNAVLLQLYIGELNIYELDFKKQWDYNTLHQELNADPERWKLIKKNDGYKDRVLKIKNNKREREVAEMEEESSRKIRKITHPYSQNQFTENASQPFNMTTITLPHLQDLAMPIYIGSNAAAIPTPIPGYKFLSELSLPTYESQHGKSGGVEVNSWQFQEAAALEETNLLRTIFPEDVVGFFEEENLNFQNQFIEANASDSSKEKSDFDISQFLDEEYLEILCDEADYWKDVGADATVSTTLSSTSQISIAIAPSPPPMETKSAPKTSSNDKKAYQDQQDKAFTFKASATLLSQKLNTQVAKPNANEEKPFWMSTPNRTK